MVPLLLLFWKNEVLPSDLCCYVCVTRPSETTCFATNHANETVIGLFISVNRYRICYLYFGRAAVMSKQAFRVSCTQVQWKECVQCVNMLLCNMPGETEDCTGAKYELKEGGLPLEQRNVLLWCDVMTQDSSNDLNTDSEAEQAVAPTGKCWAWVSLLKQRTWNWRVLEIMKPLEPEHWQPLHCTFRKAP